MKARQAALIDAGQLWSDRKLHRRGAGKVKGETEMKILFFGKLRDALGDQCELPGEAGETVKQLRRRLAGFHPQAAADLLNPGVRACIDDTIVGEDFVVGCRDSVEFFPPVSGG